MLLTFNIPAQMSSYDLITREEEILPEMNCGRAQFPTLLFGKYIYVFGGYGYESSKFRAFNACERYCEV